MAADSVGPVEPTRREKAKKAAGTVAVVTIAVSFWAGWYYFFGLLVTALSLVGMVAGIAILPFVATVLGGGEKVGKLLDWLGAATVGSWALYLNSRERQEFVPVNSDEEADKLTAYTSDGIVEFPMSESTEYQAGKRPFYLLYYKAENATETFRDGVDSFSDQVVRTVFDGDLSVLDRTAVSTQEGDVELATMVNEQTQRLLVDIDRFLPRFRAAADGQIAMHIEDYVLKEEGGLANDIGSPKIILAAIAMGALTGLVGAMIV